MEGRIEYLERVRIHAHGDDAVQCGRQRRVVNALDLHKPRDIDGAHALREQAEALEGSGRKCGCSS